MKTLFRSPNLATRVCLWVLMAAALTAQSTDRLTAKNVKIAQATFKGRSAVQVIAAPSVQKDSFD